MGGRGSGGSVARQDMSWPAKTLAHQLWWPPGGGRWGDGCKHVFVDVGMNIGVQTRKLFEPAAYPWTQVEERSSNFSFIEAFNDEFGPDRSSNVCARESDFSLSGPMSWAIRA